MTRIGIEVLEEPTLAFGKGLHHVEPRRGLAMCGPADAIGTRAVQLGFVGPKADVTAARKWFDGFNQFRPATEGNSARFRNWPGLGPALHAQFVSEDRFVRTVDAERLQHGLVQRNTSEGFSDLLDLFAGRIEGLFADSRPDVVVVCLPDELAELRIANPVLTSGERAALERLQSEEEAQQLALFQPTMEELKAAADLRTQAEDLLFRTFYRALKARVMLPSNAVPIQVLRAETVSGSDEQGQSRATRAWNIATSIYYKAGGLPWRPGDLPENVCFVGISFHHLKRRAGSLVYASVAQAFSTDVEPFALKGALVDHQQRRDRNPYLTEDQARLLMASVVERYEARAGVLPSRIVVHKTTHFQPEEEAGFRAASAAKVPVCDLVWMRSTGFRLVRRGMQEPWRGTLCTVGAETFLFTSGFVPWWKEYPGPHIPAPIELGAAGSTDLRERAREILSLTKMNWNSTDGVSRYPITLSFAKKVGQFMSEFPDGVDPNPSYRFYM
jgi:hypothetical protein